MTSGKVRGTPGDLCQTGELPGSRGNFRIAVKFHSERTSGEVAEELRDTHS